MNEYIKEMKEIPDKYRKREIPEEFKILIEQFKDENIEMLFEGKVIDESNPLLNKVKKVIQSKAPLALRLANKIMDEGYNLSLEEGLELELKYLKEIFSTEDAYEGLSSIGKKKPEFKGR